MFMSVEISTPDNGAFCTIIDLWFALMLNTTTQKLSWRFLFFMQLFVCGCCANNTYSLRLLAYFLFFFSFGHTHTHTPYCYLNIISHSNSFSTLIYSLTWQFVVFLPHFTLSIRTYFNSMAQICYVFIDVLRWVSLSVRLPLFVCAKFAFRIKCGASRPQSSERWLY